MAPVGIELASHVSGSFILSVPARLEDPLGLFAAFRCIYLFTCICAIFVYFVYACHLCIAICVNNDNKQTID